MDELTREFLIESQEGLDRMERCLTDLETAAPGCGIAGRDLPFGAYDQGNHGLSRLQAAGEAGARGRELAGPAARWQALGRPNLITGLLHLLDGLRSILKSIETADSEGEGDDAALIAQLEQLQAPAASANVKIPVQVKQAVHAGRRRRPQRRS